MVEANVLQISTPVGTAKGFQIELLNNQSSGDTKKGIVVEAIQLLKPDAVFTLSDEQHMTQQGCFTDSMFLFEHKTHTGRAALATPTWRFVSFFYGGGGWRSDKTRT